MPENRRATIKANFAQNRDIGQAGQANVLVRRGKVDEAIPIYDKLVENRRAGLAADPADRNARDQLALQLRNYGQNMLRSQRYEDAVRLIGQSHDLTGKNLQESDECEIKQNTWIQFVLLAVARDAAGQTQDALILFERARVLRQEMFDNNPDKSNQVDLMLAEGRLGNQAACLKLLDQLQETQGKNPDLRLDIARALAQLS